MMSHGLDLLVRSLLGDRGDGEVLVISVGINAVFSVEVLLHDGFVSDHLFRFAIVSRLAKGTVEAETDENNDESSNIVRRELVGVNVEGRRVDGGVGRGYIAGRGRDVGRGVGLVGKPSFGGTRLEFIHDGRDGEGDVGEGQEDGRRDLEQRSRSVLEDRKYENVVEDVDEQIDQNVDHHETLHAELSIGTLSNEALHTEQELLRQVLQGLERVVLNQDTNGEKRESNEELESGDPGVHQVNVQIGSLEGNLLKDVGEGSRDDGQEEHDGKTGLGLISSTLILLNQLGNQSQDDTSNDQGGTDQVSPAVTNVDGRAENLDHDSKSDGEREEHGEGNGGLNQKLLQGTGSSSSSANLMKRKRKSCRF